MLENLKPGFNALLRMPARGMAAAGLSPNHLTLAGLAFFGASGWYAAVGRWRLALILVVAGGLMDSMDGLLARETGKKTVFGAILDSSCDRLTEMFLLFGLTVYFTAEQTRYPLGVYFCYTAVTTSTMVSYIKARCEGAGVTCSRGLLQRPERIILLAAGLLIGPAAMTWILPGITVLALITMFQRFAQAAAGARAIEDGK